MPREVTLDAQVARPVGACDAYSVCIGSGHLPRASQTLYRPTRRVFPASGGERVRSASASNGLRDQGRPGARELVIWIAVVLAIWLAPALLLLAFLVRAMNAPVEPQGADLLPAPDAARHNQM